MLLVATCFNLAAMHYVHAAKRVAHAACRWVAHLYAVGRANRSIVGLTDKDHRSADCG